MFDFPFTTARRGMLWVLGLACSAAFAACGGSAAPSAAAIVSPASSSPSQSSSGQASSTAKPAPSGATSAASKPAPAGSGASAASGKPAASGAASGATHIEMANSSLSGDSIPLWVAKDAGIFQKNGLDVNIQLINGAAAAMSTLLSGKVEFGNLGGSAVLTAVAGGADIVVLGTNSPVMPYKLYVPPDIKTAADLKGKKVDLGTIGSAVDVATKLGIKQLGLDPNTDVVYVTTGAHSAATTALMNGAIQGRMDNPPGSVELDAHGFHPLIDLASQKIPAANSTISVTRGYLTAHHDVVQAFVDSIVQGSARARADKAFTVNVLKKNFKSDDTNAMDAAYDFWMGEVIPPLPFAKPEQFTTAKDDLAKQNPKVESVDPAKLIDSSFVQSAADRGLDKS
ncbi:MAG TPA: ABC transporter substrate-binding protein [Chloroflexota bacterium]|nr:ABC transporter substrate-binding protein [Chloroflexota bacterium]